MTRKFSPFLEYSKTLCFYNCMCCHHRSNSGYRNKQIIAFLNRLILIDDQINLSFDLINFFIELFPKYAINILIELLNKGIEANVTFDFVNQTIAPKEANTESAKSLLKHYSEWLPNHFSNHNCDLDRITILEITIGADFENMNSPLKMNDTKELMIETTTKWKAKDKEEQLVIISRKELIRTTFIRNGIPEIK